jgi:hypothetical protein
LSIFFTRFDFAAACFLIAHRRQRRSPLPAITPEFLKIATASPTHATTSKFE